jgi:hypothetical protein
VVEEADQEVTLVDLADLVVVDQAVHVDQERNLDQLILVVVAVATVAVELVDQVDLEL